MQETGRKIWYGANALLRSPKGVVQPFNNKKNFMRHKPLIFARFLIAYL